MPAPFARPPKHSPPLGGKRGEEAHAQDHGGSSPVHQATQGRTRRTGLPQQGITARNPRSEKDRSPQLAAGQLRSTAASSQARTRDKAAGRTLGGEGGHALPPPRAGLKQQSQEVRSLSRSTEHPGRESTPRGLHTPNYPGPAPAKRPPGVSCLVTAPTPLSSATYLTNDYLSHLLLAQDT